MLKELCHEMNCLCPRFQIEKLEADKGVFVGRSVNTVTVNMTILVKLENIYIILYLTVTNELCTAAANAFSATELNNTPFAFGYI